MAPLFRTATDLLSLFCCASFASLASAQSDNPALIDSPWPTYHQGPWRQASTPLPGPEGPDSDVRISHFQDDAGESMGTSPWHFLSNRRYVNSPTARTLWGVSLKYIYKYEIDGESFRLVDHRRINRTPLSIGWNFMALSDGRILVPSPLGMRVGPWKACRTRHPSLLIFRDGAESGSPIECRGAFKFTPKRLKTACGFRRGVLGTTAVGSDVLFDGSIATRIIRKRGNKRETYIAVIDNSLTSIQACTKVADGRPSNGSTLIPGPNNMTVFHLPTDDEIIAVQYDPSTRTLTRQGAVLLNFRGRTGTTPTLVETRDGMRYLIMIDARCAVTNVFRGTIECDDDQRPSEVVSVPLPVGSGPATRTPLPDFIEAVENSPAALGDRLIVTNYTGYTPDGFKDGVPDRATGIVSLIWDSSAQRFTLDWEQPDIQMSGVPTISAATGLVYSSGAEMDGLTYFYGLDITNGAITLRLPLGPSDARDGRAGLFDAGNNVVISDDGSALFPAGESLVRIRDRRNAP